ncbi:glutathione S-transferase Mu 3-like isoform X1 [Stylophora pistillata]|uniref:glutathione transferase n=1 Tax=Stylophora pistillata TaxID=50429 RepID=A0A2B4SHD3_STYPI|nr:glutathione S-transferase Mu 3-like isoform X1 [Stylophora pistillata]PFX29291.1 Glutathione S-transferase Mu 3 [Stylophora pistillata]
MAPILGYWDIRGLAEPIRLLLNYTETEFKDERYELGDAPEYNAKAWTSVKYTLGLPFPNLPYYIDGDTKISQSNAILRHIARKHDLCGTCEEEKVMVDVAENQLMDFRKKFTGLCYNQDFEKLKDNYLNDVKPIIEQFAKFLGEKKFVAGDKITFVDFILYEIMDEHQIFDSTLLEPHENLKDFLKRIEELPTIAAYLKSDRFKARPINNKMAKFK